MTRGAIGERIEVSQAARAGCAIALVLALVGPTDGRAQPGSRRSEPLQDDPARQTGGEVIDRMLAVVAGDLIMMSDVAAALEFGLVPVTSGEETTRLVLSQLIDRSLMLAEVERYAPPAPSAEQVDRELTRTRGRFGSDDAYRDALSRYGIEEAHLRATLRATLRLRAYLEQRFAALAPTDDELTAYHAAHAERFARGGQVLPFGEVKDDVAQALAIERRQAMVDDWIADLRRRAAIVDLSARAASGAR